MEFSIDADQQVYVIQNKTFKYRHRLRQAGGKWDPAGKRWTFDMNTCIEENVRDIIDDVKAQESASRKEAALRAAETRRQKNMHKDNPELINKIKELEAINDLKRGGHCIPAYGYCDRCKKNVIAGVNVEDYSDGIISCPRCHKSWID